MRVLFSSTAGGGHLEPLLPLAAEYVAQGHEVTIAAPAVLATRIQASGLAHAVTDAPPPAVARAFWDDVATLPRREASRRIESEWFAGLCVESTLPTLEPFVTQWRPELVIRETCEYAAAVVADRAGLHHAQVGISTAAAETSVLTQVVAGRLDRYAPALARRLFATPYLTAFPVSLDPDAYPTTLRYRRQVPQEAVQLGEWWAENNRPLVYLTLGTVLTTHRPHLENLARLARALGHLDARVLVTTGAPFDEALFHDLPSNVHVEQWIAQHDVLAEASVVVCHGGSGTTYGALAAGVPLVVVPVTADQPTNAELVERAGAGIRVLASNDSAAANAAAIGEHVGHVVDATRELLSNPAYREVARTIANEMSASLSYRELVEHLAVTFERHTPRDGLTLE